MEGEGGQPAPAMYLFKEGEGQSVQGVQVDARRRPAAQPAPPSPAPQLPPSSSQQQPAIDEQAQGQGQAPARGAPTSPPAPPAPPAPGAAGSDPAVSQHGVVFIPGSPPKPKPRCQQQQQIPAPVLRGGYRTPVCVPEGTLQPAQPCEQDPCQETTEPMAVQLAPRLDPSLPRLPGSISDSESSRGGGGGGSSSSSTFHGEQEARLERLAEHTRDIFGDPEPDMPQQAVECCCEARCERPAPPSCGCAAPVAVAEPATRTVVASQGLAKIPGSG